MIRSSGLRRALVIRCLLAAAASVCWAAAAQAQVEITEILYDTSSDEGVWEWVEVRNTTGAPVNLDGWVFDDDDDNDLFFSNISAGVNTTTTVPAAGVAVLYNGTALGFDTSRFTDAWGSGITLIGVGTPNGGDFAGGLGNSGDAIGLWPNHGAYLADAIGMPGDPSPRRTFNSAVTSVNYATANGYPGTPGGHSIAWNGGGSVTDPTSWVSSVDGELGAGTSVQTFLEGAPINSDADRGTPGEVPAGAAATGLLITEIMYDPRSRIGASDERPFEWVEIYNNTGSLIDFSSTPYFFDDDDDASLTDPNVASGSIDQGTAAVLFNPAVFDTDTMKAAWGSGINFIPVSTWGSGLANGGDLVALWSSLADYEADDLMMTSSPRRTADHAVAAVQYDNDVAIFWPDNDGNGSIYLTSLTNDPTDPSSWALSFTFGPTQIFATLEDHAGGDVGSPGFVPTVVALPGDYNGDGWVNAADYTVWRDHLGEGDESALNGNGDGMNGVDAGDYTLWVNNFGTHSGSGSLSGGAVPEPGSVMLVAIGIGSLFMRRRRRPILHSPLPLAGR